MRALKLFLTTVLAAAVSTVPACGTMGGMRHLVMPPSFEQSAST